MRRLALAASLLVAAPALARDALADRVAGAPEQCVRLPGGAGPGVFVLDRASIGYDEGRRLWRNLPVGRCTLRPLDTVIVEVFAGQLCRGDRFRTVSPQQSIPSAPCRLGPWVPYVKVK